MKNYTDLEQSKKLAEILPLESSDMHWYNGITGLDYSQVTKDFYDTTNNSYLPCWSLAALLNVIPKEIVYKEKIVFLEFHIWENSLEYANAGGYTLCATESYDNQVDACVAMVEKLHELKLL